MLLSIIVISHNQKDKLKRCIDSILSQPLPFEHEIIVSDDSSKDGTWELAQEYASRYSPIRAYSCNTDDYNPANNSERSGWNRCNGYKHSTGKYIAHVDGDDFFIEGSDIYQKQVGLLESHPECSCCMANDYTLKDGEDISQATLRHSEILQTGEILSSEEYIKKYFRESHCFVYRRNPDVNPVELYGGFYVDTMITDHHLLFGDIVCLNDAGYIYVQYGNSIWAKNCQTKDHLVFAHALYIPLLIPKWRYVFLKSPNHLSRILETIKLAYYGYNIRQDNLNWIHYFDVYIYKTFNRKLNIIDKCRLLFLYVYIKVLMKLNISMKLPYYILSLLL